MNYPNSFRGGRDEFTLDWTNRSFTSLVVRLRRFSRAPNETSFFCDFSLRLQTPSTRSRLIPYVSELLKGNFCDAMKEAHEFLFYSTFARKLANGAQLMFESKKDSLLHDKENRKIAQWIKFPFRHPDSFASMKPLSFFSSTDCWNRIQDQWRCVEPGIPLQIKRTAGEATPSHANQSNILLVI